ncbi:MAG TPA: YbhB/YbcL family Raf kinase inhibitor-like protein [Planctomycetota bacterium]
MTDTHILSPVRVSSPGILDGDVIPHRFTADGGNFSPALSWSHLPEGTVSVAITCDDPIGPRGRPFYLWAVYNIPPFLSEIPEGLSKVPLCPEVPGASQGLNDKGVVGYDGPAPPKGHSRAYEFLVHALDTVLDLPPGPRVEDVHRAMEGHVLGIGRLVGTFSGR